MKTKLLLLLLLALQFSFGQQRTCGMQEQMKKIMFNPVLKKQYEERQARFKIEYQKLLNKEANKNGNEVQNVNATIYIPVAVHFPSISNSTSETVKQQYRAFAQTQIDVINADYNAANTDISNWTAASSFYPGVTVGDLDVQFEIATLNHPVGTGLANGTKAITFGTDFLSGADSDPTWSGYMNFVVRDLGSGLLGYSPLGGSPAAGQTVVMNTWCYGTGTGVPSTAYVPQAPFHLGRTVTHELGHFFNLDHTFANDNGCGGTDDDGIADTPRCGYAQYNCPANGSVNGCVSGQKQLTMNYMDYVDDACMYMFTNGQKNVALAYINTILSEYKNNVLNTESFLNSSFAIYPNPNKGSFNIEFKQLVSDFKVTIFDVTGKAIYENEINGNSELRKEINLNNVASQGIYLMTIKTDKEVITKKIIIE